MRRRATVLALGVIALSSTGCGDDDPGSRTGARTPTTTTPAKVTPADYALRAERRCRPIVAGARRSAIAARRYGEAPSEATLRTFADVYRGGIADLSEQLQRLARLTPPDEFRSFQRSLRRGLRTFVPLARRARRLLAGTPTIADVARAVRLMNRTTTIPGEDLPTEVTRRAPSCATISGSDGDGGPAPNTLSA